MPTHRSNKSGIAAPAGDPWWHANKERDRRKAKLARKAAAKNRRKQKGK